MPKLLKELVAVTFAKSKKNSAPIAKADSPRLEFPATSPRRKATNHDPGKSRSASNPMMSAITGHKCASVARLKPNVPKNPGTNKPSNPAKESMGIQNSNDLDELGNSQFKTIRIDQKQSNCVNKKKRPRFQNTKDCVVGSMTMQ